MELYGKINSQRYRENHDTESRGQAGEAIGAGLKTRRGRQHQNFSEAIVTSVANSMEIFMEGVAELLGGMIQ
jgi:hypothetical protein